MPHSASEVSVSTSASGAAAAPRAKRGWLRKMGVAGFLFFFLKGMAWLIAPLVLLESCTPRE